MYVEEVHFFCIASLGVTNSFTLCHIFSMLRMFINIHWTCCTAVFGWSLIFTYIYVHMYIYVKQGYYYYHSKICLPKILVLRCQTKTTHQMLDQKPHRKQVQKIWRYHAAGVTNVVCDATLWGKKVWWRVEEIGKREWWGRRMVWDMFWHLKKHQFPKKIDLIRYHHEHRNKGRDMQKTKDL